ncbi:Pentatricopeptide repeat-containing protein [Apostasia shenzhenica]|uniref:Pentatricopeptide repeat-containing protein n=1 Tax=Apostasia shenzhenica TaxID=1088818 RepID=A0A2I0ACP1_9ASPA|nr:Pentatricopeptide repeat-containing protein [Apostasia shenzhenica]
MIIASFRRRAAVESYLVAGALTSMSTANAATEAAPLAADVILDQFLPPRELPTPPLQLKLRLELLHHLAVAVKTDDRFSAASTSMVLGFRPEPLAELLSSLRRPGPGLAFLTLAFPVLSTADVFCACDAVLILFSIEGQKSLAQVLLAGLLHRFGPALAGELFRWSYLHRLHPSRYEAVHLVLRAFLQAGMVPEALAALSEIRRQGKTPSLSANAIILRLLFTYGDSGYAWRLFRDMIRLGPRPSIRTFNAMILGSCLKGRVSSGEALIWLIPKFNLAPDACSFNIVMKAHCLLGRVCRAFQLFDEMLDSGCIPGIVTYNILINALCRQGRMEEARALFSQIEEHGIQPNTITYNVLLDGYVKAGKIDEADSMYREMIKKGLAPDCYTFNIIVSGLCKFRRDWKSAVENLYNGASSDEVRSEMLVSSLCWNGELQSARFMLTQRSSLIKMPSIAAFNSVIAGYSKQGLDVEAVNMLSIMVDEFGLAPSVGTWESLLLGFCRGGRLVEAKELLYKMMEMSFNVDILAFTIFMDSCFKAGEVSEAMACWDEMERKCGIPDAVAFSAYINGLCRVNLMDRAQEAFSDMLRRGLVPSNFTYNSLIYGFCEIGDVEKALELEGEMKRNGLVPDNYTMNILIYGLCKQRLLMRADQKLRQMGLNELEPDVVTYNTLIDACYKAFDSRTAMRYLEIMASKDCKPDIFTFNIEIHRLCRSHKVAEAMKVVDEVISEGFFTPNTVTYNTVMNGMLADMLDHAKMLAAKMIKMAFVPNVVTVNLLLSHFYEQGLAERLLMWGKKFNEVSFQFDDVTGNIFEKASCFVKEKANPFLKVEQSKDSLLEFMMLVTYELIYSSGRGPKKKPLIISSLVIPREESTHF